MRVDWLAVCTSYGTSDEATNYVGAFKFLPLTPPDALTLGANDAALRSTYVSAGDGP